MEHTDNVNKAAGAPSALNVGLGAGKRISIHWERGMFWHNDCEKSRSGIMKAIIVEENRSIIECLHCGKKGYYPVGGAGSLCCEEIAPNV